MDTNGIGSRPDVTAVTSAPRPTPTPVRVRFSEVMAKTVVSGAESAIRALPGGPMMAVALRGSGPTSGSMSMTRPFSPGANAQLAPEGPGGNGASGVPSSGAGAGAPGDGSIESTMQQSQEMNLYYLQIQEQVNAQNRSFTTLSNVLKAEHDTVKTAIGNVR
jgi:hypothetical protein